jgi:hypothetical protein
MTNVNNPREEITLTKIQAKSHVPRVNSSDYLRRVAK